MSRTTLIVTVVVVVLLGSCFMLARYAWRTVGAPYVEHGKAAMQEAATFASNADNEACVSDVLVRYSADTGTVRLVKRGVFLRACLDRSRPSPGFCDNVPASKNFEKNRQWAQGRCAELGVDDSQCASVLAVVPEYCRGRN